MVGCYTAAWVCTGKRRAHHFGLIELLEKAFAKMRLARRSYPAVRSNLAMYLRGRSGFLGQLQARRRLGYRSRWWRGGCLATCALDVEGGEYHLALSNGYVQNTGLVTCSSSLFSCKDVEFVAVFGSAGIQWQAGC